MFTDFPYIPVFHSNKCLFTPIKNMSFCCFTTLNVLFTDFINEFEAKIIHPWIC